LEHKQWMVDFANAALYLIAQLPAAEAWRADHFSVQICPAHAPNCIRVVLADIVVGHFDRTRSSPYAAAQILLPPWTQARLALDRQVAMRA
jgi:hypothetical protein